MVVARLDTELDRTWPADRDVQCVCIRGVSFPSWEPTDGDDDDDDSDSDPEREKE